VKISVLVANHNYGRYLRQAVDSVLDQDDPDFELVVADDGSTDESREILAGYGGRLVAVLKAQGGQASALNAAFERSSGDVICLMDADDVFALGKLARVRAAFADRRGVRLVHHRMQTISAEGAPQGPPWPSGLADGDMRERVARAGGWLPRAVTSALAFPRDYAAILFPIPTGRRMGYGPLGPVELEVKPDAWLGDPAPFVGPVAGLPEVLTLYRIHSGNKSGSDRGGDASVMNRRYAQYRDEQEILRGLLHERFGITPTLRLDDHLQFVLHQRAFRELRLGTAVAAALRSPVLEPRQRAREALRIALDRGYARKVRPAADT
jgi:glycosyltransferase involved in cell wall biosynthesis